MVATDANGCEVEAAIFSVVAEVQLAVGYGSIQVFPNPVRDQLEIRLNTIANCITVYPFNIAVYDILGEKVISVAFSSSDCLLPVDVSTLPQGIYRIDVNNGNEIFHGEFLKQ